MITVDVLTVVGIFMLGAAAGSMLTLSSRGWLERGADAWNQDGTLPQRWHLTDDSRDTDSRPGDANQRTAAAFQRWADDLLTTLGAPLKHPEEHRALTPAERVQWLQAKNG